MTTRRHDHNAYVRTYFGFRHVRLRDAANQARFVLNLSNGLLSNLKRGVTGDPDPSCHDGGLSLHDVVQKYLDRASASESRITDEFRLSLQDDTDSYSETVQFFHDKFAMPHGSNGDRQGRADPRSCQCSLAREMELVRDARSQADMGALIPLRPVSRYDVLGGQMTRILTWQRFLDIFGPMDFATVRLREVIEHVCDTQVRFPNKLLYNLRFSLAC